MSVRTNVRERKNALTINIVRRYPYGISRKKVMRLLQEKGINGARTWRELRKNGVLKMVGGSCFVLDDKEFTKLSAGPTINVHALQLSFPIIEDKSKPEFWDNINEKFRNSIVKYKRVQVPIGLTIQANTKQITVQVWGRDVSTPQELESLAFRAAYYAWHFLAQHGVMVDIMEVAKKNVDIAIQDDHLKTVIHEKNKVEVGLDRDAKELFPSDRPQEAKAYYDSSPRPSVETNDIQYAENYLRAPERVQEIHETLTQLTGVIADYGDNWKLHKGVLDEQAATMKAIQAAIPQLTTTIAHLAEIVKELKGDKTESN